MGTAKPEGYLVCPGLVTKDKKGIWVKTQPPCRDTSRPATRAEFKAHPKCPQCGRDMGFVDVALTREVGDLLKKMCSHE